jgi:hypothetical protein
MRLTNRRVIVEQSFGGGEQKSIPLGRFNSHPAGCTRKTDIAFLLSQAKLPELKASIEWRSHCQPISCR